MKPIEGYHYLWTVETGSGMWGTKRNDLDIMSVYCADTRRILRGENIKQTFSHEKYRDEKQFGDIDIEGQSQEIGHLINKLIDGNVNAIWSVCSPHIIKYSDYSDLWHLRNIVKNNLSKQSYHSIKGMVMSQYHDNVKRAAVMPPGKAYRGALRVANFGIKLLSENKLRFKGVPKDYIPTDDEVMDAITALDIAYDESKLPEKSDGEVFRDYLYDLRMSLWCDANGDCDSCR